MTDFIKRMMRTAGVQKYFNHYKCRKGTSVFGCPVFFCKDCDGTKNLKKVYTYPDFTADKQLELMMLIVEQHEHIVINSALVDNKPGFLITKDSPFLYNIGAHTDFTQALADLILELMKTGELDKKKVKEILQ